MPDLYLDFKADADYSGLKGAEVAIEDIGDVIGDLKADINDLNKTPAKVTLEYATRDTVRIKEVTTDFKSLTAEQIANNAAVRKAIAPQEGSAQATRQNLAVQKQILGVLEYGSDAWQNQSTFVAQAEAAYERAQGIQEGSVASLQKLNRNLNDEIRTRKLSAEEIRKNTESIAENNQKIAQQLGYGEKSKRGLEEQVKSYSALRDATDRGLNPGLWTEYNQKVEEGRRGLEKLKPAGERVFNVLNKFQTIRASIESVAVAFQIVNQTINTFVQRQKQIESFNLALSNIGLTTSEVNKAFAAAQNTAQSLGAPLAAVERSYKRMVPSLNAIGVSAADSDKFIESLSARTQVLGLNTEESGRLVEAFAQVLAKGRLTGEELNQQISELDGAFRSQLAGAIGVSTAELTELVETGGIGADQFVQAFLRMQNGVEDLQERVKTGNQTIQQLQNQLSFVNTKNIEALGAAFDPLIRALLRSSIELAEFFNQLLNNKLVQELVKSLAGLFQGFTAIGTVLAQILGPIVQLAANIAGLVAGLLNIEVFGLSAAKAIGILTAALVAYNVQQLIATKGFPGLIGGFKSIIEKLPIGSKALLGFGSRLKTIGTLAKNKEFGTLGKKFLDVVKNLSPGKQQLQNWANGLKNIGSGALKAGKFLWANKQFLSAGAIIGATALYTAQLGDGFLETGRKAATFNPVIKDINVELEKYKKEASEITPIDIKIKDPSVIDRLKTFAATVFKFSTIGLLFRGIGFAWTNFIVKPLQQYKNNNAFIGIVSGAQAAERQIGKLAAINNKLGPVLTKNTNLSQINGKVLKTRAGLLDSMSNSEKALAAELLKQADSLDKNIDGNKERAAALRTQAQALQANAKANGELAAKMYVELAARGELDGSVQDLTKAYQSLRSQSEQLTAGSQLAAIQAETKSYQDLAKGVITTEQAEVSRAAAKAATLNAVIQSEVAELQVLEKLKAAGKELSAADKKRYAELSTNIQNNAKEQSQAMLQIKQAIDNAYISGIQKNNELANAAGATAQTIRGVFESLASGASQFISQGGSTIEAIYGYEKALIDRNTQSRLIGLQRAGVTGQEYERQKQAIEQQGEARKKAVLLAELNSKYQLIELEYQIERARVEAATRTKIIEAETAQLRLRAEAEIARAQGNNQLANILNQAANGYGKIIEATRLEGRLQSAIVGLRRDQQLAALGTQAASAGFSTNFEIPNASKTLAKIQGLGREAEALSSEFGQISVSSAQTQKNIQGVSLDEGARSAAEMRTYIGQVANEAQKVQGDIKNMASNMANVAQEAQKLYNQLKAIAGLGGGNQRAFGGPVVAGTEYFVNDGGGREAFLSRSGQLSMLPAGRNMRWVAPSSGMIIPANLVQSVKDSMAIRDMNRANSVNKSAGSRASGNLIGRGSGSVYSNSSSNTQRIVNNVTIQSQEPVQDASKLMVQVARIKGRRRI